MRMNSRKLLAALAVCGAAGAVSAIALADISYPAITGVPTPQPKVAGIPVPNVLASGTTCGRSPRAAIRWRTPCRSRAAR